LMSLRGGSARQPGHKAEKFQLIHSLSVCNRKSKKGDPLRSLRAGSTCPASIPELIQSPWTCEVVFHFCVTVDREAMMMGIKR
jgi:hypothetical protein